jgi:NADH dehydrogenase
LVAAAKSAGAELVLVSGVGVGPHHAMELFGMKAAAEDDLRASGVPWTIIRATAFLELYLDLLRMSAGKTGRPVIFGRGENPINFVPVQDVATAVAGVVLDPTTRGRVVNVSGPRNYTMKELAGLSQADQATPTSFRLRHVPRLVLHLLGASGHLRESALARQASAALIMDTIDMTFAADLVPAVV